MKWLALLCFAGLAKSLNGQQNPKKKGENPNQHDHEKISILKIDRTQIGDAYLDGAETLPPPTIEHGDFGAEKFKEDYDRIVLRWGEEVYNVIYRQGLAVGHNLINDVEDNYNNLANSIGQSSNTNSERNSAEKDLKHLVNQLKTLLDLEPGNRRIEHEPLPEFPNVPTPIISQTKNRTASDFFLHLPKFFDEDMSSMYGYIAGIYLGGWYNSRKYFDIQQMEYRNQILNNAVLPAYRKVVEKVFKYRDSIRSCVTRDTWTSFENYGNRIIKISNEWLQALVDLEKN